MSKYSTELEFENVVIEHLTKIGGVKQWEYLPHIKTTEQLWDNFKKVVEQNNRTKINGSLSDTEFSQVKRNITNIRSPYEAGQFLYGVNGVSEIEIDLDDGRHVFLTVFDQAQVGGGSTVYQVVNQIERKRVVDGKRDCRFDITLLINGLPIIQIELKTANHNAKEAINQMQQYIADRQYTDIFSTLQILVAMTPYDIRYMSNTTIDRFNDAFAFNWQNEMDASPVRSWQEFANKVLSIPMAHDLATRYMILDGTKNKESLKVMRPYQVYATKRVLDKVRKHDFKYDDGRLGYIWHTTGSGKTITSFKTAWLASRLSNVDKVVFLVDRIALTNQTVDSYQAYDPVGRGEGVIADTANVSALMRKLNGRSDQNIIVTSIQKMSRYVTDDRFKKTDDNILFIVDEAHRSVGDGSDKDEMLGRIRASYPGSGWVGYTGTPVFSDDANSTANVFGELLHAYTIKEAIADKNVLGFKVEFKETIEAPENPTEEDIDDAIKGSVYDYSEEHVDLVVKDIFDNWRERSANRKYNALFTVHVGGGRKSTPRAMEYYDRMMEENEIRPADEKLKVGITFSMITSNNDDQLKANQDLHRAIMNHNKMFNTSFDMSMTQQYVEDITRRLNKTTDDENYLDLVIVVDQLLTGFDAPELNTLYVDRTLKGRNLIQAYSRTNRIHNFIEKPYGNVINYRWPVQNEYEMNNAFRIYSNRDSANEQLVLDLDDMKGDNEDSGIIAKPFSEVLSDLNTLLDTISDLTDGYVREPRSERQQEYLLDCLKQYNQHIGKIKQYSTDDDGNPLLIYEEPEKFYDLLNITRDQEIILTTVIYDALRHELAKSKEIDISEISLSMTHIIEITINYDYLIDLIAQMADEVNANEMIKAQETRDEINLEIAKSDSENEKIKYHQFVDKIFNREYVFEEYPAPRNVEQMTEVMNRVQYDESIQIVTKFIRRWGLDNSVKPKDIIELIKKHQIGTQDLDKQRELTTIMNDAKADYISIADDDVKKMSWVKYRIEMRVEFYEMADEIKGAE